MIYVKLSIFCIYTYNSENFIFFSFIIFVFVDFIYNVKYYGLLNYSIILCTSTKNVPVIINKYVISRAADYDLWFLNRCID